MDAIVGLGAEGSVSGGAEKTEEAINVDNNIEEQKEARRSSTLGRDNLFSLLESEEYRR